MNHLKKKEKKKRNCKGLTSVSVVLCYEKKTSLLKISDLGYDIFQHQYQFYIVLIVKVT